jgi:hypothetical protein
MKPRSPKLWRSFCGTLTFERDSETRAERTLLSSRHRWWLGSSWPRLTYLHDVLSSHEESDRLAAESRRG